MCRVISVSNQKGGVGKTTTACSVAVCLNKKGFRVLLIDMDPQGNLSFCIGADPDAATIYDVLKGDVKIQFAIQKKSGADIIASSVLLSGIELEFTSTGREYLLREAIKPLLKLYDYVLIDTPPGLGILTINAFTASNAIIVPMLSDIFSLQGIAQLSETVSHVRKYSNPNLILAGILLTKYNPRTLLSREVHGAAGLIAKDLNIRLFDTFIRDSVAVREAQSLQKSILEYSPKNNVSKDYMQFVGELLQKGM